MMIHSRLHRPIFFIGVPRSGTTILFEAFARHENLGWLSNYSRIFPRYPIVNILRFLLDNRLINWYGVREQHQKKSFINKLLPRPAESYPFYATHLDVPFARDFLLGQTASENAKKSLVEGLHLVMKWQGKRRFATKLTGPARINYLSSIFDDAIFVHVIRDGRAVVNSLLKVSFWTEERCAKPWWDGGISKDYLEIWVKSGYNAAVLAAIQWRAIIELARKEANNLALQSYYEVHYEEFIQSPHRVLSALFCACELEESQRAHKHIRNGPKLRNMNRQYELEMEPSNIELITESMQPLLSELGYT